ncbi:TPA: DUF551 domain-containing protein [Escherichia coli]|nr:DUF551 domain-containing protein [Enterobacter ludwigii]
MTFTKEQLQHIIETDHVQCGDASALARMALAGIEAEPVAWAHRLINKRNGVVHPWVYGSAEACPSEGDIFNIEVMPLYTAPPAPVSVPDEMEMDDDFDSAFEHGKAVGWNACRAAMLQGAEPVTTAYKLRYAVETIRNSGIEINAEKIFAERDALNSPVIPDGWVACSERMPETMVSVLVTGTWFHHSVAFWDGLSWCDLDFEQPVTHWMPLPAAPQQEA